MSLNLLAPMFDRGIDIQNRRVFLGEIDEETTLDLVKGLYYLESLADDEPIEIFINSCGGSVEGCFAIVDIIHTIKCPVHTFAYGICMSAAPLVLASGEKGHRWVSPNLRLMVHDGDDEISGTSKDLRVGLSYSKDLDDTWYDLMRDYTGTSVTKWKALCGKGADYYFKSDLAIELGLADQIWEE